MNDITNKPKIKIIIIFILLLSISAIFYILGKILLPFIVALIIAYVLNPIIDRIIKKFLVPRGILSFLVALITFIFLISIPMYVIPSVIILIKNIIDKIPVLINFINTTILTFVNAKYHVHFMLNIDNIKLFLVNNFSDINKNLDAISPLAKNSFILISFMLYMIIIPFIVYFAVNNWHKMIAYVKIYIPKSHDNKILSIAKDIDNMLSQYLRGQFLVMVIMACYYGFLLKLIHLEFGFIVGILTGVLVFIPYLGVLSGLLLSLLIGISSYSNMQPLLHILIIFVIGHILEGTFVTPFLVGSRLGINPVMVILALLIFAKVLGVLGIIFALPLLAIFIVLFKYFKLYYFNTKFYND